MPVACRVGGFGVRGSRRDHQHDDTRGPWSRSSALPSCFPRRATAEVTRRSSRSPSEAPPGVRPGGELAFPIRTAGANRYRRRPPRSLIVTLTAGADRHRGHPARFSIVTLTAGADQYRGRPRAPRSSRCPWRRSSAKALGNGRGSRTISAPDIPGTRSMTDGRTRLIIHAGPDTSAHGPFAFPVSSRNNRVKSFDMHARCGRPGEVGRKQGTGRTITDIEREGIEADPPTEMPPPAVDAAHKRQRVRRSPSERPESGPLVKGIRIHTVSTIFPRACSAST